MLYILHGVYIAVRLVRSVYCILYELCVHMYTYPICIHIYMYVIYLCMYAIYVYMYIHMNMAYIQEKNSVFTADPNMMFFCISICIYIYVCIYTDAYGVHPRNELCVHMYTHSICIHILYTHAYRIYICIYIIYIYICLYVHTEAYGIYPRTY